MSKHDKQIRRERKKRNRARRQRAVRTAALASAAALAAGTSAYAVPVRFDNPAGPGQYDWLPSTPGMSGEWLDITFPPASQPGTVSAVANFTQGINAGGVSTTSAGTNSYLQVGGPYDAFVLGETAGELIPTGASWNFQGYAYYPGFGSQLPEGQETYLGVRFNLGSGYQYGWIGVVRSGPELEAFAWGYETEPGVPICAGASAEDPNCAGGCVGGDMDDDGDVDADDVPLFVDALLGKALPPGTTDRSDLDACGPGGDGDDMQAFVDKLLE